MIKKCKICGKEFEAKDNRICCSDECSKINRSQLIKEWKKHNKNKQYKYTQKYYQENREKQLQYVKKYYCEHKEKCKEYQREYYQKNRKEPIKLIKHKSETNLEFVLRQKEFLYPKTKLDKQIDELEAYRKEYGYISYGEYQTLKIQGKLKELH